MSAIVENVYVLRTFFRTECASRERKGKTYRTGVPSVGSFSLGPASFARDNWKKEKVIVSPASLNLSQGWHIVDMILPTVKYCTHRGHTNTGLGCAHE